MLTLHLLRHAKTKQESHTGNDFHRELMEKGVAQANMLGNYLQLHHIELGYIICSSAVRTSQTQYIICKHVAEDCKPNFRKELYLADYQTILSELSGETSNIITLIGHNDGISDLASYLSDEDIQMQTCEFLTFAFPFESWNMISRGTGILSLRHRPEVYIP